jgi:hypothetical protein
MRTEGSMLSTGEDYTGYIRTKRKSAARWGRKSRSSFTCSVNDASDHLVRIVKAKIMSHGRLEGDTEKHLYLALNFPKSLEYKFFSEYALDSSSSVVGLIMQLPTNRHRNGPKVR